MHQRKINLGFMYDNGWGVPRDYAQAAPWYRKAADQGYASAQFTLGARYQTGLGVAKDDAQAVAWFRKAADLSSSPSSDPPFTYWGLPYQSALTVPINQSDAVDASLPAPRLISPADGAVFDNFPRTTSSQWEVSPGAVAYIYEWDYGVNGAWRAETQHLPGTGLRVRVTTFTWQFVGAQPGRWRVWPVNAKGIRGSTPSEWRTFRYTR